MRLTRTGWRGERGEGKLQFILITVVLVFGIGVMWRTMPIFMKGYNLQDFIRTQAKFHNVKPKSVEEHISAVLLHAQDLRLPIERDQIKVTVAGVGARSIVKFKIHYTVTMDLFVYKWVRDWDIEADTESAFSH